MVASLADLDDTYIRALQRIESAINDRVNKDDRLYQEIQAQRQMLSNHDVRLDVTERSIDEIRHEQRRLREGQDEIKEWLRPRRIVRQFFNLLEDRARLLLTSSLVRIIAVLGMAAGLLAYGKTEQAKELLKTLF